MTSSEFRLDVPDFSLTALDGSTVRLTDLKGKVIVLDFYSSGYGQCRAALLQLQRLYPDYRQRGTVFLGVAINDQQANVEQLAKDDSVSFPMLLGTHEVAGAYGLAAVPETWVIDQKGRLAFRSVGFDPDSGLGALAKVLGKLAPRTRR